MKGLRLYKAEKLCSRTAIDRLFSEGKSLMAYPFRVVFRYDDQMVTGPVQFMISIPKKRIRHAVDRVTLRRRVREAYRLHRRTVLHPVTEQIPGQLHVAIIFVGDQVVPYATVQASVVNLLQRIADSVVPMGSK